MTDPSGAYLNTLRESASRDDLLREIERHIEEKAAMRAAHDARVTELLEANNREVERRRAAERVRGPTLEGFIADLMHFQLDTFGPLQTITGVLDHVTKELEEEIRPDPTDNKEWLGMMNLSVSAQRINGATPSDVASGWMRLLAELEARTWPDWRAADPDRAIEHDRTGEAMPRRSGRATAACKHKRLGGGSDCQCCIDCGQEFQPAWRNSGPQGETNLPPMPSPEQAATPPACELCGEADRSGGGKCDASCVSFVDAAQPFDLETAFRTGFMYGHGSGAASTADEAWSMSETKLRAEAAQTPVCGMPFTFLYLNYKGEIGQRRAVPMSVRYGSTEWHQEPQWLLRAFDLDKQAEREFAMKDILVAPPAGPPTVDNGNHG